MAGLSHRQTEILNIARAFGRVMVEDLARRFEVSAQTIRKDLNDLCDHRSLTRIHGGAIIASGVENLAYEARRFVAAVDSSAVVVNASTRFNDGGQFGLGAEVAVSTQKLHARGPMGLVELTTYKWVCLGDFHVRP